MKFFNELKRRNVVKETLAYLVIAWVLLQVASIMLPIFDAPDWVLKTITFTLVLGIPIWIFFSWTYQITTEGFKKTSKIAEQQSTNTATYKRLNIIIIITLILAIAIAFFNPINIGKTQLNAESDLAVNNSVAVLPFLDMSPEHDQEYLSIGIAEDILNRLCKFKELSIIASTSSFSFKDKNEDIKTIGEKLNVSNILEGSVRKNETDIIITVRLTNAEKGTVLLSESYSDDLQNIIGLQSNIALDIANKIESKLSNTGKQLLKSKKIDPIAFESFLKGRSQFINGPLNMLKSEIYNPKKYFEAAIAQDPSFADAHAYLALIYFNIADWAGPQEDLKRTIALDSAELLSKRALLLDSLSSGAHLAMGSYYFHQYNWIDAEKEKRKAVVLNPGGPEEKFILASFLGQFGQTEEAQSLSKEALLLDPIAVKSKINYLRDLYFARQYDSCISMGRSILREHPNSPAPYQFLQLSYLAKKQYKETSLAIAKFCELNGDSLRASYFKNGNLKSGVDLYLQEINDSPSSEGGSTIYMSWLYALIEEKDSTLKYLNLSFKKRLPQISFMKMPYFDFLRDDPRYLELYKTVGFKAYDDYKLNERSRDIN